MKEQIFFHKGLAGDTRGALQQPGFLKTSINLTTDTEGDQYLRQSFAALNTAFANLIHSVRRFEGWIVAGHGGILVRITPGTGATQVLYSSFTTGERWRWREYKRFLHGVNGYEEVLFDEYGQLFPAEILNPLSKCSGVAGAAHDPGPEGHYMLYCSYYITFENGMVYETGLSPVSADVNVTDTIITWTVPLSTYAAHYAHWGFNVDMMILHGGGVQQGTVITDSTGRHTVTVAGNACTAVTGFKFHEIGSSLYFDGTNSYLTSADSADWNMGTGQVSIDFHVNFIALPTTGNSMYFWHQYVDANNDAKGLILNTAGVYTLHFYVNNATTRHEFSIPFAGAAISTWYHIAFIRGWGGSTTTTAGWAITINGTAGVNTVITSNPTVTWPDLAAAFEIGRYSAGASYLSAYIADFRVRKGATKWQTNFAGTVLYPDEPAVDMSIRRKLYRGPGTGGTIADIYYVGTIYDNTTTSYSDDLTDAELAAQGACTVEDYGPGPHSKFIDYHYGRLMLVNKDYPWRQYYSEAAQGDTSEENENLMPIAFLQDNWDDLRVSGFEKTDIMGTLAWGTNYFVAFKQTWIRRQGNDPDTWSWKKTWAKHGVCASDTIATHHLGILYLTTNEGRQTGIALFNGQTSEIITSPKLDYVFNSDLAPEHASTAIGTVIGNYYHLLYQTTAHVWKWLALDLRRFPDVRAAYWEQVCGTASFARALDAYSQGYDETNALSFLVGGSDGIVYYDTATAEAMNFEAETHNLIGGNPQLANELKVLKELKYNLDSDGDNVTVQIYIDGTLATWPDGTTSFTISGTGDTVQVKRDFPPNFEGYMFRIRLTAASVDDLRIYSPWSLDYNVKGA